MRVSVAISGFVVARRAGRLALEGEWVLAACATCQELSQSRIGRHESVSLLAAVAAVEGDRDRVTVSTEHPPHAPGIFPAAHQGDEVRAARHLTCIP
jgi:hypothetical protein